MSHSVHTKIFIFARLFTACAALLLLTATVLERNDPDGYQATHLFFMPRQNWEMDLGLGMLHDPDYYTAMDRQALAVEDTDATFTPAPQSSPNLTSGQTATYYLLAERSFTSPNPERVTVSRAGVFANLAGNTIPLEQTGADYSWELGQVFLLLFVALSLTIWLGDIPTPPPRRLPMMKT
jgi:hypothetical protein